MIVFPALMVGAHLIITVADPIPNLDVRPSCRAAASGFVGIKQDMSVCLDDEKGAREQLVKEWPQFGPEDNTRCTRMATSTYTELLVCLEMARDAKKLPKEDAGNRR